MAFSREHTQRPYEEYTLATFYSLDPGTLQLPVAAAGDSPSEVVRTHASLGTKRVVWTVARSGVKPQLPSPEPNDSNQVLLRAEIAPQIPQPLADGSFLYRIHGTYVYALRTPVWVPQGLDMGSTPITTEPAATQRLQLPDFSATILGRQN